MTTPERSSMSSFRDAPQYLFGSGELDRARLVPESADGDGDGARRQEREELVGPLDHGHPFPVEHLVDAHIDQLGEAGRPVGVDVVEAQTPRYSLTSTKVGLVT